MDNDCQYREADGLYCWQNYENGEKRRGPWKCAENYHWVKDNERLAVWCMPDDAIKWLLVAESPPCPRDEEEPPYIYRIIKESERRPILEAIIDAYKIAACEGPVSWRKSDKLRFMKKKGAFVIDLCCSPLNKLDDDTKEFARLRSEGDLKSRVLDLSRLYRRKTENIAIIGIDWRENAIQAIDDSGMGQLLRNRETRIPFPTPWRRPPETRTDRERCVDLLSLFFKDPEHEKHASQLQSEVTSQARE